MKNNTHTTNMHVFTPERSKYVDSLIIRKFKQ